MTVSVNSAKDETVMIKTRLLLLAALVSLPLSARAETYLLMAEEAGCYWCARWHSEIGPIYPKTAEGKAAPLVQYNLRSDTPDAALARKVHYTPTFILVEDGQERGRIEGYPGEDFFWGLLGRLLEDAKSPLDASG